ncbi:MAG: hypothetical protein JXM70_06350 [Pirellulales bacterium]|nr:hypothetical protein [Pirellulales bacterium]
MIGVETASQSDAGNSSLISVDYRELVSRSDLIYKAPVKEAVEGHAVGNGRMGSMVWTTPAALHMQINRNDVFAVNKDHIGSQTDSVDYCSGCGLVTVEVGGSPFARIGPFEQKLCLYDGEELITGKDVSVRCFACSTSDVMVVEIDDRRKKPLPLELSVSMWRAANVITPEANKNSSGYHRACYDFLQPAVETVVLLQQFDEYFDPMYEKSADYHCRSAVAVKMADCAEQVLSPDKRTRKIVAPAKSGKRLILISSAASFSRSDDVSATAKNLLDAVMDKSYKTLRQSHVRWWHDFWSRTFVDLSSKDGSAETMERIRNLHLYYMASSSRGLYPPKWNGSIFAVDGDDRNWGAQYWIWTTESLYWPLLAADAVDLTDSFFDMYVGQLNAGAEQAGPQRWGVAQGAYYPETAAFDGPVVLPADVGKEFKDVLYGVKTKEDLSDLAKILCGYCSQLRAVTTYKQRFSWISHVASSGSEIAVHAWWRYRHTGDKLWLATHAYPLLKGTAEFYRHLAKKGGDGLYHIEGTNAHEDYWGTDDGIYDLAAIRGTVPLAIRAAEILDVDAELRTKWQAFLDKLAPYVMGSDPGSVGVLAKDAWAAGHYHFVQGSHNSEDVCLVPVFPFEDWTLETHEANMDRIVRKTMDLSPRFQSILKGAKCNTAIRSPVAWARAGRGEMMPKILASYYKAFSPLGNGMSLFEGKTAHSIEHLGMLTCTIQEGLLQSVSPRPGQPEVIRVFGAWPKSWDASFRLKARGGFLVTAAIRDGEVEFVEIESRLGETCRLRNPWEGPCCLGENGGMNRQVHGEILQFDTESGGHYRLIPAGQTVSSARTQ